VSRLNLYPVDGANEKSRATVVEKLRAKIAASWRSRNPVIDASKRRSWGVELVGRLGDR